jgi:hypothetical protein
MLGEAIMYPTTQNFIPLAVFGAGYVQEQHGDEKHRYLPCRDERSFVVNFDELLKKLRAALSLR